MKSLDIALALLCIVLEAPVARGVSIKSVQVWSYPESSASSGTVEWKLPNSVYVNTLGSNDLSQGSGDTSTARQPINQWTFVGCFKPAEGEDLYMVGSGVNPVQCTELCERRQRTTAAMRSFTCLCPDKSKLQLVDSSLCDEPCLQSYYNSTTRLCGGQQGHVSAYQQYDMVHQTAQGCYDPRRFLWYQSVAIERVEADGQSGSTVNYVGYTRFDYYLHASSINSGEPIFPYHLPIERGHYLLNLQYDLISSRIVGLKVRVWDHKTTEDLWVPKVEVYRVKSLQQNLISFTRTEVPLVFEGRSADYQFSTGVSALDANNNLYFITMPVVPTVPRQGDVLSGYKTLIYGINLEVTAGSRVLLKKEVEHKIVLLEANSVYHDLFALLQDSEAPTNELLDPQFRYFYYAKLGHSSRNDFTGLVEFYWTFRNIVEAVVNPHSFMPFVDKYYQVGTSSVDHLSNTSFFIYKDLPNADQPLHVRGISQRAFLNDVIYPPLPSVDVQGTWLVNDDPQIPLTLPSPKLLYARYTLDGRRIMVQFDSFTAEGALPIDTDGDYLPDLIDFSYKQVGPRNCSDMFATVTAKRLGSMPETICLWRTGTTIQISLPRYFEEINVGDAVFLKDQTIYAYVQESNEFSYAASGGITVTVPDPLLAPLIDMSYAHTVDLCSSVTINGEKSRYHGGMPIWTWKLHQVYCVGREESSYFRTYIEQRLSDVSAGGFGSRNGNDTLTFGKDDLEPGCEYTIMVTLLGRWQLESTEYLKITKRSYPAPQVTLPGEISTMRSKSATVQAIVETTQCESLLTESLKLKFEWTAVADVVNEYTGALEQRPVDLSIIQKQTSSASLLIPKLSLLPGISYTMTVAVGYESTWSDPRTKTQSSIVVLVTRSPIKVNVIAGSRKVVKSGPTVIDSTTSLDPDFPADDVEVGLDGTACFTPDNVLSFPANSHWSFTYECTTLAGDGCFPNMAQGVELPEVKNCQVANQKFEELGKDYPVPAFSSSPLASDAYYCKDPTRTGVLILNAESPGMAANNYTFVVRGTNHERQAAASITLEVVPPQLPGPKVLLEKISEPRVDVTKSFRVRGNLVPEDRAQYADDVRWSWSFFKEEANPRWSQASKLRAIENGEAYQVPERISVRAPEFDVETWSDQTFRSQPNANNLVVRANVMQPSNTYSFRLTATAPNPYGPSFPDIVGYADATVRTAGLAPSGGFLIITPADQSYSTEPKLLEAQNWMAEDVPMSYMFSYSANLQNEHAKPVNLRISPLPEPSQSAFCFKAGEEADNYNIRVTLTVANLFGASSQSNQLYKSLPPLDPMTENDRIFNLVDQVESGSQSLLLNCIYLGAPPTTSPLPSFSAPGPAVGPVTTPTPTSPGVTPPPTPPVVTPTPTQPGVTPAPTPIDTPTPTPPVDTPTPAPTVDTPTPTPPTDGPAPPGVTPAPTTTADGPQPQPQPSPGPTLQVTSQPTLPTTTTTTTTTTPFVPPTPQMQAQVERLVDVLDAAAETSTVTEQTVMNNLNAVQGAAEKGVVSDNMIGFVEKMSDSVVSLAADSDSDEVVDEMAGALFNTLGAMGETTVRMAAYTSSTDAQGAVQGSASARSVNMNGLSSGAFFPSSSMVAASTDARGRASSFGGGVRSLERRLKGIAQDTYRGSSSGPRRLGGPLDEQEVGSPPYIVQPGAYPDWRALPSKYRDPEYASRRRSFYARSTHSNADEALAEMYDQQEALELEWSSYINATAAQDDFRTAQVALDAEYFANYSAHLSAGERESVVREWWEERARTESLEASRTYQQAQLTRKSMATIGRISSVLVKYMVTGELPKDFNFPMGLIRIGKTRNMQDADKSFALKDQKWKIGGDSLGAYGFGNIKYTQVNPMSWSANAPIGPFLVSSLEVFSEDGTPVPVNRESQPLSIMQDHSSFASASCFYWDWEARDGLGGWSETGLLTSENGCSSTHLSLIGMFLDSIAPEQGLEVLSALDSSMDNLITKYNELVVIGLGGTVVIVLLLHYWSTKQDQSDRTKPMEMKKLGDGIRGPRTQDDPVDYASNGFSRACKTFWNLLTRDHILVACFCRCPKMKTSRLQKVSALFAMLSSNAAVAALFFGEHVVDPKHFIEVGIIAAVITYPMVRVILLMFSLRPAREMPRPEQSIFSMAKPSEASFTGVLEAVPVPEEEEEEEEEEDVYGDPSTLALAPIAGGHQLSLPAVRAHSGALSAPPAGRMLISAPEQGGGPQAGILPQPAAVEQVLAGRMPPAPPHKLPPPPPPLRGQPLASDRPQGREPSPPMMAPPPAPPPIMDRSPKENSAPPVSGFSASSSHDSLAAARAAAGLTSASTEGDLAAARAASGMLDASSQEGLAAIRTSSGLAASSSQVDFAAARAASGLPTPAAPEPAEAAAGSPVTSPERPPGSALAVLPSPSDPGAAPAAMPQMPGYALDAPGSDAEDQLALAPPPMPLPDSGASEIQSQTQAQLLRRVRKVYIEKVIRNSERLAYDERVDMKSSVPHPMAQVANALAYTAVVCFWTTALVLTGVYSVHLNSKDALRWLYACLIGWAFTWFVLEFVKAVLVTILELQQLKQRRRIKDHNSLRDQVAMKKARKLKAIERADISGMNFPGGPAQIERSPIEMLRLGLPPPPVPPERGQQPDASAGF